MPAEPPGTVPKMSPLSVKRGVGKKLAGSKKRGFPKLGSHTTDYYYDDYDYGFGYGWCGVPLEIESEHLFAFELLCFPGYHSRRGY